MDRVLRILLLTMECVPPYMDLITDISGGEIVIGLSALMPYNSDGQDGNVEIYEGGLSEKQAEF